MKLKITIALIIMLAIVAAALYLRYGGVTHERIVEVIDDRAEDIKDHIDDRSAKLYLKMDSIEKKLDRLLEIADRPLVDGPRK